MSQSEIEEMYEALPGIQFVSVALGLYQTTFKYDANYITKKAISERLSTKHEWESEGRNMESQYWMELDIPTEYLKLYSPVYTLAGEVSDGVSQIQIRFVHQSREYSAVLDVVLEAGDTNHRQQQVSLGQETLFNGLNEYEIMVIYQDGAVLQRSIILEVHYERIELGDTVLFLDPYYIPAGQQADILWETEDFDGLSVNFLTFGCDPAINRPEVLIENSFQYDSVPACLTFSIMKRYLLLFEFSELSEQTYFYDIVLPDKQILFPQYPLYVEELGNIYMSLVFWDQQFGLLKSIRMRGDLLKYLLEIVWHDIGTQQETVRIKHLDGHELVVETPDEKILVYMYKDRDNYHSLVHPGLRYVYYVDGRGESRRLINQGSLVVLPVRIVKPRKTERPTYDFSVSLVGNNLTIDDGIHIVSLDIMNMGQTIDAQEKQYLINQPTVCESSIIDMYENLDGEKIRTVSPRDRVYLVGEGLLSSQILIYHNGKTQPAQPDWSYKGYMLYELSSQSQNLVPGENIYTIVLMDQRDTEICRKTIELSVSGA